MKRTRLPKYVQAFVDRTGRPRHYFRRGSFRQVLPGLPYSAEFMAAYQAALAACENASSARRYPDAAERAIPGSFDALISSYYRSAGFRNLKPITQSTYRNRIEAFRKEHGKRQVGELQRKHVRALMAKLSDTPDKANRLLKTLRILTRHALDMDMIKIDPCHGIRKLNVRSEGFATWTEDHIAAFYARHAEGTRARLAMDLLLHTGQRRQDIVRMGPSDIVGDQLVIIQSKTGSKVFVPIYGPLLRIVAETPKEQPAFLVGVNGRPLAPESFTNWFRKCVVEAGLPKGLSPHGLRKAVCRRLAEAGCSEHEIMAISGHRNVKEVSVYTRAADRSRLAGRAIASLEKAMNASSEIEDSVKSGSEV